MAVKIRLQRFGTKKKPYYRIVAADSRFPRDGRYLEQVGTYNPMVKPEAIALVQDRFDYWMSVGAQPSDTVASLVRRLKRSVSA
jgi:small subunit ribosomal protein S16